MEFEKNRAILEQKNIFETCFLFQNMFYQQLTHNHQILLNRQTDGSARYRVHICHIHLSIALRTEVPRPVEVP